MARCRCCWRKVLLCVCTSFICMALLFVYVAIMLCMNMNTTVTPRTGVKVQSQKSPHFVASGMLNNKGFAPLPKTFWEKHLDNMAFWNRLQLTIDRHFNAILYPSKAQRGLQNNSFDDFLLKQSFSEVIDMDHLNDILDNLPQEMQEFVSYMQNRDYPILLQPDGACGAPAKEEKEPPLLLLAIKTTEMNFMNRQAIRQTWGQTGWVAGQKTNEVVRGYIRRVFLLGKENQRESGVDVSESLKLESERYGDILQWDFEDKFFHLALKDVLFWSWFSRSCNRTRFIFKGDDDVFVNTPNMIAYLQDQLKKPQAYKSMINFMVGDVIRSAIPNRTNKSKYFIPDSFYNGYYPRYAGGGGVVYSGLLAKRLHHVSKRVHLFPIDDVYVGMCMSQLNALPIHHPAFLTFDFPEKEEELCSYHTVLLVHKRSANQMVKLWDDVKKTRTQCRDVALRIGDERKKDPKL
ncbi:N-acetyllactosaminide beta-1,3-N-acetylglucosaminyltransferase 2-like [Embiotoca jacksoni]|uniref:N-acetyllactosaminide beta-1,3-N-acetylglucosaminyltransferase 2-like n=1 Tax=Embiotoca jacksoni TaxID=100190 RepID=UPI0037045431